MLAAPALVIIVGFVLLGLAWGLTAVTGSAKATDTSGLKGFLHLITGAALVTRAATAAITLLRSTVSHWALAHIRPLTGWLLELGTVTGNAFKQQAGLATDTAEAIDRLAGVTIPTKVRAGTAPVARTAGRASRTAHTALGRANATSTALGRYKASTSPRIARLTHAVDVTLPRSIGGIRTKEETLSRDQSALKERTKALEDGASKTWEWIRTHPLGVASTAFAGAVAIALGRLGLGALRCNNFTNLLRKHGCGLGQLLERLLGAAVFLTLAFDFKLFVQASQLVATGIADTVAGIEGVFDVELPPLPPPNR